MYRSNGDPTNYEKGSISTGGSLDSKVRPSSQTTNDGNENAESKKLPRVE